MTEFLKLLFLFAFGATIGWCMEVVGRSIRAKKLINPGFLNGCCLPIYGFGAVILHTFCGLNLSFIGGYAWQIVFYTALVTVVMTAIELVAGIIFIKGMKLKLWDYSNRWGNVMGIICPLFTLLWGAIGVAYRFLVYPWLNVAADYASINTWTILIIGIYYGVLIVDLSFSLNVSAKIRSVAQDLKVVLDYEDLKNEWSNKVHSVKSSYSFFTTQSRISKAADEFKQKFAESAMYKYFNANIKNNKGLSKSQNKNENENK